MTLPDLPDFTDVFTALHDGHAPYPWQKRLAAQVVKDGRWPSVIGVPTGTGKTATLDIALYALAADAARPAPERRAPRRIVMVVDRRTIVDQSFRHALDIRQKLTEATTGPLVPLRERLVALMGMHADREEPLQIALLRGGVPRDDGWARRPDQALIALSTVDQVGSRLLFRGYGVRHQMQSLHAGLLGHDTLVLLDEVHLARAFEQTLSAIDNQWRNWREQALPDRWQVVTLSATSAAEKPFELTSEDRAHPRLRRRLEASKPLRLRKVDTKTHNTTGRVVKKWVKALEAEARGLVQGGARCVGVVVNRVDTARAVADLLERGRHVEVQLVTGRMRAADRIDEGQRLIDRASPTWRERASEDALPFVCVATQCIEAGADLDFDALVTEIASLDAIVQRFGRANRTGDQTQAPVVVVAPKDIAKLDDPIYGEAPQHAWAWLRERGDEFDASTSALEPLLQKVPRDALAPRDAVAILLPTHLDLLAQTGPVPSPDPDPALYLHGLEPPRPEVQIVWRADITLDDLQGANQRLAAVPPTSFEALPLPIAAARRWLAGEFVESFGDVESEVDAPLQGRADDSTPVALAWDGEQAVAVSPNKLRPGQTLVVPAHRGGLRRKTFDPTADAGAKPIEDVGDLGRTIRTGRPVLRLDPRIYGETSPDPASGTTTWMWRGVEAPPSVPDLQRRSLQDATRELAKWLETVPVDSALGRQVALLRQNGRRGWRASVVDGTWVLTGRRRLATSDVLALARGEIEPPGDAAKTADDNSITSAEAVALDVHLRGVGRWAEALAQACGLPGDIVTDLRLAGEWHDLGKAHPLFQVLLHDGDEIRAAAGDLRAKSGTRLADRAARQRAWERARLPSGFRHEMASVSLLTSSDEAKALLQRAHDRDLVLHLVASHHGHGRPFAPIEDHTDVDPLPAVEIEWDGHALVGPGDHAQDRADSGVAERFWRVQRRYGWWGLAWLEAILRLADHRESEAEERPAKEES